MVSVAARIGGVLGAAAAFMMAMARGGPSVWAIAGLTACAFALVAVVLFIPSETPARRLGQLIQAWRNPTGAAAGPEPGRTSTAPSSPARNGS
ncbi:hypothetical protein [Streptomyces sp. NPDC047043]|uniref:hypothetical protein n=1 Tax=Streptomyces sp. NPDC047043 TaxID=3154497 RepID=UPI0033C02328